MHSVEYWENEKDKSEAFTERIMEVIFNNFPGSFSAKQIARIYSRKFEEVTTKKVSCALNSLWMDGYLEKHVVRVHKKGNKNRYRAIQARLKKLKKSINRRAAMQRDEPHGAVAHNR
jgi:hypothetical protein